MEKIHAMTIRKLIATSILTMLTAFMLLLAPSVMAADDVLNVDSTVYDSSAELSDEDCLDLDEDLAASLGCDTSDQVIDFTEYEGEFEGPEETGYDEALTTTTSAREFIQTIVNFALSFLGLIATIIIIYGGVMYVTSRGDEEMATKGKKTIGYAVFGIVIILGSFALVNTLIGAGGGGADTDLGGGAAGTTVSDAGAEFDVESVLNELEAIVDEYTDAYTTYLAVTQIVANLQAQELPYIVNLEVDDAGTISGFFDGLGEWLSGEGREQWYEDYYELFSESDIDDFVDDMRDRVQDIQREVDSLSDTYEAAQDLYNYLQSGTDSLSYEPSRLTKIFEYLIPIARADSNYEDFLELLAEQESPGSCNTIEYEDYEYSVQGVDEKVIGKTAYEADVSVLGSAVCSYLTYINDAATADYREVVNDLLIRVAELGDLFVPPEEFTTGSTLTEIYEVLADPDVEESLYARLDTSLETISASTVRGIIDAVDEAYGLIQNIEFVNVVLTASATEGNAPLIVSFDILGTEDPSGLTVEDEQIFWDLEGTGDWTNETSDIASRKAFFSVIETGTYIGDATSFTYDEAGTYRVRVRVASQSDNVAAGVATVSIKVEPPKSVIILEASTINDDEPTLLADFTDFPYVDEDAYKVTMAEATEGITFDATQSTDGDGNTDGIVYYEWDFGDNDTASGTVENAGIVEHAYGEEGRYEVSLTITDSTGIEDRKYFTLYVASPAARIAYTTDTGDVDTEFTFDGTASSTDVGSIASYQWSIMDEEGNDIELEDSTGSTLETTFAAPGVYTVTLTVKDSSGTTDDASVDVLVESKSPVATYDYEILNDNEPATFFFDATDSYDPDEGDILSYEWDFDGTEAEDYIIIADEEESAEMTVQFLAVDDYDVTLTACDQYEEDLQQCSSITQQVAVTSVLDVDLEVEGESGKHLDDDGIAEVEFTASSEIATAFEIDYGDGETDFTDSISQGQAIFTHEYEDAGVFYVTLTALDDDDNENSIIRRVYIAAGDSPIAVISVTADGEDIGFGETLTGNVNTRFSFDASNSVNVDGSTSNLSYSWNFGDGSTSSQSLVTKTYDEHATYEVALIVKDKDDPNITDETSIFITIEGIQPEIRGITITPQGNTLETPLKVNVEVDASDDDGEITFVKAWYYDLEDSATELGTLIAQTTSFTLTVNTKGEEDEKVEYGFAVEVTDDDNNTVSSLDELGDDGTPTLEVVNGPNDTPVAAFSVDQTSVYIGEEVTFSSTSYDPDGEIVYHIWDVEGDGFYNNEEQEETSYVYTFTQIHTDGIDVQLKVEDDSGATATSDTVRIYVDSLAEAPVAKFLADVEGTTVNFRNNSDIDEENGAELEGVYWDFDLATDSDGDGVPSNDFDSFEENPTYEYEELGTYEVLLTIVDTTGQTDSVTQEVTVIDASDPKAEFSYSVDEDNALKVKFTNESEVDEASGLDFRSYIWDFDLNTDSDDDGDPENDEDSTKKSPSHEYEEYGEYEVLLTIEDTLGNLDTEQQTIDVPNPIQPVEAVFTSVPSPNTLGQIILEGTEDDVTFFYNATGGSEDFTYTIDKNIFYDTSKDGKRDNDIDHDDDESGSWKTTFFESYGQTVVKLTVTDEESGESDIATLQVVFEGQLGGANLFNATPNEMLLLIISALLAAVLGVSLAYRNSLKS